MSNEKDICAGRITKVMNFDEKVLALTTRVPTGRVTSYAEIAHALGTQAYRAVGNALNRNPYGEAIPCHRVIGSNGKLGGYGGKLTNKIAMLQREGVSVLGERVQVDDIFPLDGRVLEPPKRLKRAPRSPAPSRRKL